MSFTLDVALIPSNNLPATAQTSLQQILNIFRVTSDIARTNISVAQKDYQYYYDKSTVLPRFQVNDRVLAVLRKNTQISQ